MWGYIKWKVSNWCSDLFGEDFLDALVIYNAVWFVLIVLCSAFQFSDPFVLLTIYGISIGLALGIKFVLHIRDDYNQYKKQRPNRDKFKWYGKKLL